MRVADGGSCRSTGAASRFATASAVREKYGVEPLLIPDLLALMGDSADGYPGLAGIGRVTAARLIGTYGAIENFPADVLGERRELALLFKSLATLRTDADLFTQAGQLRWQGPEQAFAAAAARLGNTPVLARAEQVAARASA